MPSRRGVHRFPRFFLVLLVVTSLLREPALADDAVPAAAAADASGVKTEMKPMVGQGGLKSFLLDESSARRRLTGFQVCALCTCCGGPRGLCLPSPCCYAINCNIPNRPFGFCAFTPKACDCLGCYL